MVATLLTIMASGVGQDQLDLDSEPAAVVQYLLCKEDDNHPLKKLAPALTSLFCEQVNFARLSDLLECDSVSETIFTACLNHVIRQLPKGLEWLQLLAKAIQHFGDCTELLSCLWGVQVFFLTN